MCDPREKWNRRWSERSGEALFPDPWLVCHADLLPTGTALDLACGRGGNALFLARRGCQVTALDISEEALRQLASAARTENLPVVCRQVNLEGGRLPNLMGFALATCFYYLYRPLLPWFRAALTPGGVAVLRTFSRAGRFPPSSLPEQFVLSPGELLELFPGWQVLVHEEGLEAAGKGGSLAGIIVRKPVPDKVAARISEVDHSRSSARSRSC